MFTVEEVNRLALIYKSSDVRARATPPISLDNHPFSRKNPEKFSIFFKNIERNHRKKPEISGKVLKSQE